VIPVIDLKARFGLPESEQTDESRILVIHVGGNTTSIIVDAVKEVLRIGRDQIAPPPPTVANLGREYLLGLVKLDDQLLILLDIERLLPAAPEPTAPQDPLPACRSGPGTSADSPRAASFGLASALAPALRCAAGKQRPGLSGLGHRECFACQAAAVRPCPVDPAHQNGRPHLFPDPHLPA